MLSISDYEKKYKELMQGVQNSERSLKCVRIKLFIHTSLSPLEIKRVAREALNISALPLDQRWRKRDSERVLGRIERIDKEFEVINMPNETVCFKWNVYFSGEGQISLHDFISFYVFGFSSAIEAFIDVLKKRGNKIPGYKQEYTIISSHF